MCKLVVQHVKCNTNLEDFFFEALDQKVSGYGIKMKAPDGFENVSIE